MLGISNTNNSSTDEIKIGNSSNIWQKIILGILLGVAGFLFVIGLLALIVGILILTNFITLSTFVATMWLGWPLLVFGGGALAVTALIVTVEFTYLIFFANKSSPLQNLKEFFSKSIEGLVNKIDLNHKEEIKQDNKNFKELTEGKSEKKKENDFALSLYKYLDKGFIITEKNHAEVVDFVESNSSYDKKLENRFCNFPKYLKDFALLCDVKILNFEKKWFRELVNDLITVDNASFNNVKNKCNNFLKEEKFFITIDGKDPNKKVTQALKERSDFSKALESIDPLKDLENLEFGKGKYNQIVKFLKKYTYISENAENNDEDEESEETQEASCKYKFYNKNFQQIKDKVLELERKGQEEFIKRLDSCKDKKAFDECKEAIKKANINLFSDDLKKAIKNNEKRIKFLEELNKFLEKDFVINNDNHETISNFIFDNKFSYADEKKNEGEDEEDNNNQDNNVARVCQYRQHQVDFMRLEEKIVKFENDTAEELKKKLKDADEASANQLISEYEAFGNVSIDTYPDLEKAIHKIKEISTFVSSLNHYLDNGFEIDKENHEKVASFIEKNFEGIECDQDGKYKLESINCFYKKYQKEFAKLFKKNEEFEKGLFKELCKKLDQENNLSEIDNIKEERKSLLSHNKELKNKLKFSFNLEKYYQENFKIDEKNHEKLSSFIDRYDLKSEKNTDGTRIKNDNKHLYWCTYPGDYQLKFLSIVEKVKTFENEKIKTFTGKLNEDNVEASKKLEVIKECGNFLLNCIEKHEDFKKTVDETLSKINVELLKRQSVIKTVNQELQENNLQNIKLTNNLTKK